MREKKTPGSTPGRTPKGFRALFSLWESKREGRSPLRRGKSAGQAEVPEVPSSPLRPSGDLPTEASETPDGNEPLLNASSPAMLMAARTLLSASLTWSATPKVSASKQHCTTAPGTEVDHQGPYQEVVNPESVEIDLSKDYTLRHGGSEVTPTMGDPAPRVSEQPSLPHDLSTPQMPGERPASRTPTEVGLTPPTLSAHNPFPAGTHAVASASDDCSASEAAMSSKFSTCDEGSVEQSPGGSLERHRVQHAGHTPAPRWPASQPPSPPSDGAVPPHHTCDADLDRSASGAEMVFEASEEPNASSVGVAAQRDASVNVLGAPVSSPSEAVVPSAPQDVAAMITTRSTFHDAAAHLQEPYTRPEVSSPIIESLERSGGSDALARAGSSGVPRSGSSGAARAAAAPVPSADASVRHRHQRSGALDFDSALLLNSVEDVPADASRASPTNPAPLDVTTGDQDGGGDMRGSDDSVVLHPTPCATTEAPDITQYHPESFMGDVDRCCLHQASQGSESVPVDMRSPSLMDAAPSDGMLVVAPPKGQLPQHIAPVTAAEESTHSIPDLLPGTPTAAAQATDDVMTGVTPLVQHREQDSIMAGTSPAQAHGCASFSSPSQPAVEPDDSCTATRNVPVTMPTPVTDVDVPMLTPAHGQRSPEPIRPDASAELLEQDSPMLALLSPVIPMEVMTGHDASVTAGSVKSDTKAVQGVDDASEAGAAHMPEQESLIPSSAEASAGLCVGQAQAETPKADPVAFAPCRVLGSPGTESAMMPVAASEDPGATPLRRDTKHDPAEGSGATPKHKAEAAVDSPEMPVGCQETPVEGTPDSSNSFALKPVQFESAGETPTEVQLSRVRGLIADGTSAFQVADDPDTPATADPADAVFDFQTSGACGKVNAGTTNDDSEPLKTGSALLAVAPCDSADLQAASGAAAPSPCLVEAGGTPLPMLSPVEAEASSPATVTAPAAVQSADRDTDCNSVEIPGRDDNSSALLHASDSTPMTSCSQVPVDVGVPGDDAAPTPASWPGSPGATSDIAAEPGSAGGGIEDLPADLVMECSDAVVEHDEDSCTRVESPAPPAVATPGISNGCGSAITASQVTPGDTEGGVSHTREHMPDASHTVMASAGVDKEFTFQLSSPLQHSMGVRESTDSKYAPSGTDSILGIASGICGAAVAGALTSSTSLQNSQTPLSPTRTEGCGELGHPPSLLLASPMSEVPVAPRGRDGDVSTPAEANADGIIGTAEILLTPPDSGRPSLRNATPAATPQDTALHPISDPSFRVTDSCADRVWRMLQGAADGAATAAGAPRMSPTAEEVLEDGTSDGLRDSPAVPEFPSLDEAAYAQLEREALQGSGCIADLPVQPAGEHVAAERPSTPPAPLQVDIPPSGANAQVRPGDSPHLQPTFCDSPGIPARRGGRRSGSASHQVPCERDAPMSAHRGEDLRQTAITDTLVNQSLSMSLMFPGGGAGGEVLLESVLDDDSAEPEALPSPTHLELMAPHEPSKAPGSLEQVDRCKTAPPHKVGIGRGASASRRVSMGGEAELSCPVTSTFDAAAIISKSEKRRSQRQTSAAERPKTAGPRQSPVPSTRANFTRPSTSSALHSRGASQTPSLTSPLTSQQPMKRSLSHKTIHNISPNHNPNYRPHTPGKTPQAVPPNPSPFAKRCRNHEMDGTQRLGQPLDIDQDLPDVDDLPLSEPTSAAQGRMQPGSANRADKVTPPLARPSRHNNAEHRDGLVSAQNLRDSLLTLDPMRLSYGPDGLVNLAGDEDKVLFQADIEAITQALDTFPSQSDITNENKSAQPHRPGPSLSPGKGISPLRLSSARKQRMPGSDMAKAIRADCDVEDLQLQLAVAVRQAEHFRRENATLQERNTCLQEYIEAETFLGSGQDNTETLLAEVSPEARQEESFASERSALQAEVATLKSKCEEQRQQMHVLLTQQLPAAHAAKERAEAELVAERTRSAAAVEAATAAVQEEQTRLKRAKLEAGKLRTDLERHAVQIVDATESRHRLEDALAKAHAATEAAEGRYQTKCKELSMTKLARPTGIGGGIGAAKLKQDLAAMTAERDAVKGQLLALQDEVGRVTRALHAKEAEYEQLSHSFHQALSRWELRGQNA